MSGNKSNSTLINKHSRLSKVSSRWQEHRGSPKRPPDPIILKLTNSRGLAPWTSSLGEISRNKGHLTAARQHDGREGASKLSSYRLGGRTKVLLCGSPCGDKNTRLSRPYFAQTWGELGGLRAVSRLHTKSQPNKQEAK